MTENRPHLEAAGAARRGKDAFRQCSSVTTRKGLDLLKRCFGSKWIRIHQVLFNKNLHPWHIDVNGLPLRPGLRVYNPEWSPLTEEFKTLMAMNARELVPAAERVYVHKNQCYLIADYSIRS